MLLVFLAVLLLALTGSAIGMAALKQIQQASDTMVRHSVAAERLIADAYRYQAINAERYKAIALSSEPEVAEALGADVTDAQAHYDGLLGQLTKRLPSDADAALLLAIHGAETDFAAARAELIAARDSGLTARITKVYADRFLPSSNTLLSALATLMQSQRQAIDRAAAEVAHLDQLARAALLVFGTLSLLLGLVLARWLVRGITRPIALAGATADRVARLDLRQDIDSHERDETGRMLASLAVMQNALRTLVVQVRDSAQNVSSAAAEIATSNTDLSGRTEETAARLQQAAASLEHITVRVVQSAAAAQRAQRMVATAATVAQQGGHVVARVQSTVQAMDQSAHQIANTIGVIDTLAFQTNILALNAAVEAAHAGPHGRGFAVVAAEVRSLAHRSAAAAQEIKVLIGVSTEQASAGARLAQEAGTTMQRMVQSAQDAHGMMEEIVSATQDQNRDIAHINSAVSQLDLMTQANSALVEESSAASARLRSQAQELAALISQFILPGAPAGAGARSLELPALAHRAGVGRLNGLTPRAR